MSQSMTVMVVLGLAGILACATGGAASDGRPEGDGRPRGGGGPAGRYADEALALAGQITAKLPAITQAAEGIAERMVAGHALWLGGSYEGFIVEGYYRAGGMMKAGWLKKPEELQAGDVLLLGTVEEANPQDEALVKAARARGALVVRIGPEADGRGEARPEVDLGVPCEGVAAAGDSRARRPRHALPLVSAGDTMMLWTLTGEIVGALTRRGKMTPMFESVLVPGGTERNAEHLSLQWEPTCPPAQKAGRLGRTYLSHVTHYLRDLRATQLPQFAEAGRLVREAVKAGRKAYVIPFGHLPPYEVNLAAEPGVFAKLPSNTDGKALAKVVREGDVVLYVGYYELPEDIVQAAHAAGAKVISFVSGTPQKPAEAMGADVNIAACWPFGDAAVEVPGYDVRILPPSGVMTAVGFWLVVGAGSLPPRPPSLEGRGEKGASPPGPLSQDVLGGAASRAKPLLKEGEKDNGEVVSGRAVPLWPEGAPGAGEASLAQVPTITPYLLDRAGKRAAIIVCPGGGYAGRAPYEGAPISQWLNTIGVVSFVCDYRVAPYKHPRPLQDAQRAIRWVRAYADECGVDPKKVGILGFSAGGHLSATVGTHYDAGDPQAADPVDRFGCRPDALILCYPVISFGEYRHHGSMVNLIGENPPEELRRSLSNETQVTPDTPPTFLWHTSDDGGVSVQNSLLFAEALSRCKVPFDLHVFRSGPHGMALAEKDAHVGQWRKLCETWLRGLGW